MNTKFSLRSGFAHAACALLISAAAASAWAAEPAPLILRNANVWTVDAARPTAQAIAISGERIVAVGTEADVAPYRGPATRVMDLGGAMVLPGFIDAHTHFGNAVDAFFTARVIDVDTEAGVYERLRAAAARVPPGMWIQAVDLAGLAAAAAERRGDHGWRAPVLTLAGLDAAAPRHPVVVKTVDGQAYVNSAALRLARLDKNSPNPPNGALGRDPATRELTGLLKGSAVTRLLAMLPPPSRPRNVAAGGAIVKSLNALGITGIHDIARVDAVSREQNFSVAVERSYTDMAIFQDLRQAGALSLRVHALLSLAGWRDYARMGIRPGSGDDLIRYGALKGFIDAVLMREPMLNNGRRGTLAYRVTDLDALKADIIGADKAGFDLAFHVLGDAALDLLLDSYQGAIAANPARERRFRIIHMWYTQPGQLQRAVGLDPAGKLTMFADVTPSQLVEQLGSIDAALGPQRAAGAFPWRSAAQAGLVLDIGSDWPGTFDGTALSPVSPLHNIAEALARTAVDGDNPPPGWRTGEAMTVDEAIRAYTLHPAMAAREEGSKGSITPGKLADLVVLARDIRKLPPRQIAHTEVLFTFLGGKMVYDGKQTSPQAQ